MVRTFRSLSCGWVVLSALLAAAATQSAAHVPSNPAASAIAKLTASDGKKSNELGYSVGLAGDTVVLGAPYATIGSKYAQGAAYVFVKTKGGWRQEAKLTASDGGTNAFFGSSVSISGDTIVVGADGANIEKKQAAGAAYVFLKSVHGWKDANQTAKLTVSEEVSNSYFGSSVAVGGDTIAIGSDGAVVGSNPFQGAVYIFNKPPQGWTTSSICQAKLTASDGGKGDQFGYSVFLSKDAVVAGARSATVGTHPIQGAAYLFVKPSGGWTSASQTAKLIASDGDKGDQFGTSVSLDGDSVVVGSPGSGAGAAYIFVKPTGPWPALPASVVKLTASEGENGDQLGYAVSIQGRTVAAGAPSASVASTPRQGRVYLFTRPDVGWAAAKENPKLVASHGGADDRLGASLALGINAVVSGAPGASATQKYQGATYIFEDALSAQ